MTMYFESDYDKDLRKQRIYNIVKDYGIWDRPKFGCITVSVDDLDIEKDRLYRCKDTIMHLVYLAKYVNTHEQLPQEYKDLMKHYALQIEKVMGDKL